MTEQVIDIRDRIEKMRNQMTVPGQKGGVEDRKKPANDINDNQVPNQKTKTDNEVFKTENIEAKISAKLNVSKTEENKSKSIEDKVYITTAKIDKDNKQKNENLNESNYFKRNKQESKESFKKYDDYQNERVVDENKQSVKIDEKQPFPQFSLNVSNPISWKLMLLIMLMQLLTNMMLVVVLYLK